MLPLRFGRTMSLAKTPGSLVRFTFRFLKLVPTVGLAPTLSEV